MAVKKVMISTSAKPWGQKRTTLTQELMRGLLNCSKELPCLTRRKHFNDFMQPLKNSGYSEPFRAEILVETSIPPQRLERIFPLDGKEEEEEGLAWKLLEVVHLHLPNLWVAVGETHAGEGGRDEGWRKRRVSDKDNRNCW